MLFSSLLTVFAATASLISGHGSKSARACRDELESIVYTPQNCAYDYLKRITRTLEVQSPLLWTDQADSVLNQFRATYRVEAVLIDPFGNVLYNPPNILPADFPVTAASVVRAWALGEGFSSYNGTKGYEVPFYGYSVNVWNRQGQMYTITVALNKTDAPLYC